MSKNALNEEGIIAADDAFRGVQYLCPECYKPLILKGGQTRSCHFSHLPDQGCLGVSDTHRKIQRELQKILPGTVHLEMRAPSIGRIADVAWVDAKIIFEVQLSPIDPLEVRARRACWNSIGYQVVWVLHEDYPNRAIKKEYILTNESGYFYRNGIPLHPKTLRKQSLLGYLAKAAQYCKWP